MPEPEILEEELIEPEETDEPEEEGELVGELEDVTEEVTPELDPVQLQAELQAKEKANRGLLEDLRDTRRQTAKEIRDLTSHVGDLQQLMQGVTEPTVEEELGPEPDIKEVPAEHLRWHQKKDRLELEQAAQEREQDRDLERQGEVASQNRMFAVAEAEKEFLASEGAPSFEELQGAIEILKNAHIGMYTTPDFSRAEAAQYVGQMASRMIDAELAAGNNPAGRIWQMYQDLMRSIRPAAKDSPTPTPSKAESAVEAVEKGVRQGGIGQQGGSPTRVMTIERAGKLDTAEYQKWRNSITPEQWEEFASKGRLVY